MEICRDLRYCLKKMCVCFFLFHRYYLDYLIIDRWMDGWMQNGSQYENGSRRKCANRCVKKQTMKHSICLFLHLLQIFSLFALLLSSWTEFRSLLLFYLLKCTLIAIYKHTSIHITQQTHTHQDVINHLCSTKCLCINTHESNAIQDNANRNTIKRIFCQW